MARLSFHCQKCGAGNPVEADLCQKCGTRILLIVEPPSTRYEVSPITPYEEYLLERLTVYERYVDKIAERFERVLELLSQHTDNTYKDHTLLATAISLLTQKGVLEGHEIGHLYNQTLSMETRQRVKEERHERLLRKFLAGHGGEQVAPVQFVNQVKNALSQLKAGRLSPCIKSLESAVLLSPQNSALLFFLGLHFYRADKPVLAREYLARGLQIEPQNGFACLLLGLLCGDSGNTAQAADILLDFAEKALKATFVIPYSRGRLHVAEGQWEEALECFKQALAARPCPEGHYALGCAYYQLNRFKLASRMLNKAIEGDEDYAQAWYGLGLIAVRTRNYTEAAEFFGAARDVEPDLERYCRAAQRKWQAGDRVRETPPMAPKRKGSRLISGGDKRLALFLRKETLRLCASLDESQEESETLV